MRFYVEMVEREQATKIDQAAILQHRLASIEYQQQLYQDGILGYAFKNEICNQSYLMFKVETLEQLDELIKQDPLWIHSEVTVTPVTTTKMMLQEMNKALGYVELGLFTDSEMENLDSDEEGIDPESDYTLAAKTQTMVPASVSEEYLQDVWKRTVESQSLHLGGSELADHNPVGRPEGILIGKGQEQDVRVHVESAPVFPDTDVVYTKLLTLKKSHKITRGELEAMNRPIPPSVQFDNE